MKLQLIHRLPGRLRLQAPAYSWNEEQAVALEVCLETWPEIKRVRVYEASSRLLVEFDPNLCEERVLLQKLRALEETELILKEEEQPRLANRHLRRDLFRTIMKKTAFRYVVRLLPFPWLAFPITCWRARTYLYDGWLSLKQKKLDVSVLDAAAILLPLLLRRPGESANIMYLLGLSEVLEEYTVQRARNNLADQMAWTVDQVWLVRSAAERQKDAEKIETLEDFESAGEVCLRSVPAASVQVGDILRISTGMLIPFDSIVVSGQALLNQASLTGEAEAVFRKEGQLVLAGTTVTEGVLDICVQKNMQESRIHQILQLLEQAEGRKAQLQYKAEILADRLVPMSFALAIVVFLLTGNIQRVAAVLAVDYSCALKLSLPIAVLSAMQSGAQNKIAIRGGDHLEAYGLADTLVFDKTGTLTTSEPQLMKVVPLAGYSREEVLRMAACIEEHFPHSLATAVVQAAQREGIHHAENHSKVQYIVAHGVVTEYDGEDARIGSYHFIFEDSGIPFPEDRKADLDELCGGYSTLYLSYKGELIGVLCIDEPLRPEAADVLKRLRGLGFQRLILMTGDGARAARRVAQELKMDAYYAECLPEDKVKYIRALQDQGAQVVMVGDGVNDSPALAQADVSVAMRDASDLARDAAHISLLSGALEELVDLRILSEALLKRAKRSYKWILAVNSLLLLAGAAALAQASLLALLHNTTTLGICLSNLLPYPIAERKVSFQAKRSNCFSLQTEGEQIQQVENQAE